MAEIVAAAELPTSVACAPQRPPPPPSLLPSGGQGRSKGRDRQRRDGVRGGADVRRDSRDGLDGGDRGGDLLEEVSLLQDASAPSVPAALRSPRSLPSRAEEGLRSRTEAAAAAAEAEPGPGGQREDAKRRKAAAPAASPARRTTA